MESISPSLILRFCTLARICHFQESSPEAATGRPADPFTTHRFLAALERSGSTGPGTGWQARPLLVHRDGTLIAAAQYFG